jgi:hypothetical protein
LIVGAEPDRQLEALCAELQHAAGRSIDQLTELDFTVDLKREANPSEREHHLGWQGFIALQTTVRYRLTHGLLDLALRGDTDLFKKLSDARVERVLIH